MIATRRSGETSRERNITALHAIFSRSATPNAFMWRRPRMEWHYLTQMHSLSLPKTLTISHLFHIHQDFSTILGQ